MAYVSGVGVIWYNGSSTGKTLGGSATAGDFVCVAVDMDNKRFWARRNAGNWNGDATANPATNVGGVDISSVFASNSAYPITTMNSSTPVLHRQFWHDRADGAGWLTAAMDDLTELKTWVSRCFQRVGLLSSLHSAAALISGGAWGLSYIVNLENRVATLETSEGVRNLAEINTRLT